MWCLISDVSLFTNSGTFQLRFECHMQTWIEISPVTAHFALLRGRPTCHVESNVAWGRVNGHDMIDEQERFTQFLWRQSCMSSDLYELSRVSWPGNGSCLISYPSDMTGNALWIITNHLTHSNSRSKWFYELYRKMNFEEIRQLFLWSSFGS